MSFTKVEKGVCAAKGFVANGLNCGLNSDKNKNDLALVYSEAECQAAAVYTTNKVKGAPIQVTKAHLEASGHTAKAVIANSKNANTCNADGVEKAQRMCELAAAELSIDPNEVIVASTGVIGQVLPIEPIESHIKELAKGLSADGNDKAVNAIMTTDTVPKQYAVKFTLGDSECTVGGMAKGSGMIHPNMATTLNFITSDVAISSELIQKALSEIVKVTYNCLSIDGDTSTNDTCIVMANGMAGNELLDWKSEEYHAFYDALYEVALTLAKKMAADGEGASRLISCTVKHSRAEEYAERLAKEVIASSLVKAAMYGADANWGRVLCAMGYSKAPFRPEFVNIGFSSAAGSITVCENGEAVDFDEDAAKKILLEKEVSIDVDIQEGEEEATAYGCDLTYDYVRINGDYRT